MKICTDHWAKLRAAIHAKGMSHLGASSGEEAAERLKAELDGTATDSTFDPLMAANNMIWSRALEMGGLYLMTQKEDGTEYCPLCEVDIHGGNSAEWIDGCTDFLRKSCEEKGLIRADVTGCLAAPKEPT